MLQRVSLSSWLNSTCEWRARASEGSAEIQAVTRNSSCPEHAYSNPLSGVTMVEAGLTSQSSLGVWLRAPAVHRRSHTGSRRIACSSLAAEEHRLCGWSPRVGRGAPCITRNCARGRHSHIYNIRSSSARRAAWCTGRPQFPDGCKWCDGCSSRAERHFAHHKEVRREVTPCLPHRCHQQRPELFPSPAVCPSNPQEESHRQQTHHSLEPHHRAAQALWLEPPARQRRFAHRSSTINACAYHQRLRKGRPARAGPAAA